MLVTLSHGGQINIGHIRPLMAQQAGDLEMGIQGALAAVDQLLILLCRVGMPLRYNYDKPEKPRISRVFGYQARFFILFQPEKSSREVVIS